MKCFKCYQYSLIAKVNSFTEQGLIKEVNTEDSKDDRHKDEYQLLVDERCLWFDRSYKTNLERSNSSSDIISFASNKCEGKDV